MGAQSELLRFFRVRRQGLEIRAVRRPSVEIPDEWQIDYIVGRLLTAGIGVTLRDLNDWRYSWEEIWQMHDMLDLRDWIDWQAHAEAERLRSQR